MGKAVSEEREVECSILKSWNLEILES